MARLLPSESAALEVVAREVGVGAVTLERWREDAQSRPAEFDSAHLRAAPRISDGVSDEPDRLPVARPGPASRVCRTIPERLPD